MLITDSTMVGNRAIDSIGAFGGSLVDILSRQLIVRNVTFRESFSDYLGGAAYFQSAGYIEISESRFENNFSKINNGLDITIFLASSTNPFLISGTTFTNTFGVSVRLQQTRYFAIVFTGCRWLSTKGIVSVDPDVETEVQLLNSEVSNLQGRLLFQNSYSAQSPVKLLVSNCTFTNLTAANGKDDLIHVDSGIFTIRNSKFINAVTQLDTAVIVIAESARLIMNNVEFSRIQSGSVVQGRDASTLTISRILVTGESRLDRGVLWTTGNAVQVSIDGITLVNVSSRCGIAGCIENAASVRFTDVSSQGAFCLKGNALLSSYYLDCALVVSTAANCTVSVVGVSTVAWRSWILFGVISLNGTITASDVSVKNSPPSTTASGVIRVVTLDGSGSVTATNFSVEAMALPEQGSIFRIEYVRAPSFDASQNMPFGMRVSISRLLAQNVGLARGVGAVLSFSRVSFLGSEATSFASATSSGSRPFQLTISMASVSQIFAGQGGAFMYCSGRHWDVNIQDASFQSVYGNGPDSVGGVMILESGCRVRMDRSVSNSSWASGGGFASVLSGSALNMARARVAKSVAAGPFSVKAAGSAELERLLSEVAGTTVKSDLLSTRALAAGAGCDKVVATLDEIASSLGDDKLAHYRSFNPPGSGGAFLVDGLSSLRVADSQILDTAAVRSGGILHVFGVRAGNSSWVTAANVTTLRSAAVKGGVIYIDANNTKGIDWTARDAAGSCVRFGPEVATSPAFLRVFPMNATKSSPSWTELRILSGQALPALNASVVDAMGQAYLDASFFSLVMRSPAHPQVTLVGKRNAIGLFGAASFESGAVNLLAPPGNYSLAISTDDLFKDYPSSRLNATVRVVVLPCPPGRYVSNPSLSCDVCPTGTIASTAESKKCAQIPDGFYSVDGIVSKPCGDSDADTLNGASALERSADSVLNLKKMQCSSSGPPVLIIALSTVIPLCVILSAGLGGVWYQMKRLKAAQARSRPWLVNPKDVEWIRKIGEGSFGEVFICQYHGTLVCMKKLKSRPAAVGKDAKGDGPAGVTSTSTSGRRVTTRVSATMTATMNKVASQDNRITSELEDEIKIHVTLSHPNIVLFMGAILQSDNICLMTEFMIMGRFV
jgi:hypothetical protein